MCNLIHVHDTVYSIESYIMILFHSPQSVFHGPIHKKQDKDNGGKKPSDRSWRSLYAAIQKHWMVFYGSVQDALAVSHSLYNHMLYTYSTPI